MKNKIISALFIGFTILTFAQTNNTGISSTPGDEGKKMPKRVFSELTIGIAIPQGDFASTGANLEEVAGFAVNGGFLFANYGVIYNNLFGYEVAFSLGINPLDKKIDDMLNNAGYPSNTGYDYDYGKWSNINIMLGPHFSLPIEKFALDLRLLGGYMYLERPFIKQTFNNGYLIAEQNSGHGSAFVWQLGTGMRYSISKDFDIKFSLDYFKAKPKIKYQRYVFQNDIIIEEDGTTHYGVFTGLSNIKYTQPISSYNFGIGVVFYPK